MTQYFDKLLDNINNKSGFLFFNHIKDIVGISRKLQIEKNFKNIFYKKIEIIR